MEPEVTDSAGKVVFTTIRNTVAARKYYQWSYLYDIKGLSDNITGLTEAMNHWADGIGAPPFKRHNTTQWLGDEPHDINTDLHYSTNSTESDAPSRGCRTSPRRSTN